MTRSSFYRTIAAVLVGLVTSLGLAWGLAWRHTTPGIRWSPGRSVVTGVSHPGPRPRWHVTCAGTAGVTVITRSVDLLNVLDAGLLEVIGEDIPGWSAASQRPAGSPDAESTMARILEESAFGWPFVCLRAEVESICNLVTGGDTFVGLHGGSRIGAKSLTMMDWREDLRFLPFRPIPLGLALNTLFYGAGWWLLLIILILARRSLRKLSGRCPRCGYNLRRDWGDGCSECGWNRGSTRSPLRGSS